MNFTARMARVSLGENRRKNLLIGITVMLTAALLTSVGLICIRWGKTDKMMAIENAGTYHGIYKRISINDLRVIENNLDIERFGVVAALGTAQQGDMNLDVEFMDENTLELTNIKIEEGNMPQKLDDIAIESAYLKELGRLVNVGDKIKIQYEVLGTGEKKEKEFCLSGILETGEVDIWNKSYSAFLSQELFINEEALKNMEFNVYVRVKGENNLSGGEVEYKARQVAQDIGISNYDVKINDEYIDAITWDMPFIAGAAMVAFVVILSSILVIYSIFYVSIMSRVQEYGRLRAIGATKKQIKGIVLREGMAIGVASIPVGLFLGFVVGDLIFDNAIVSGSYNVEGFNVIVAVGVFILCLITIFVALLKPMKIAVQVSPVEAMRFNGEDMGRKKERRGYEFLNITRLTYANIVRNKKRTMITIVSLGLSGILFIAMSTIMGSISGKSFVENHMQGDFLLTLSNYTIGDEGNFNISDYNIIQENNPLGEEVRARILQLPGVKEVKKMGAVWADLELPSGEVERNGLGGFDEEEFQRLRNKLVEGDMNYETMMEGNGIIFTYPSFAEEYGIKVGEKIELKIYDGRNAYSKEFIVEGIANVGGEVFLVPNKVLYDLADHDITSGIEVMVQDGFVEEVGSVLKEIAEGNQFIELKIKSEEIASYEEVIKLIKLLGYSLVVIIGVIGFINLVNTMITSVIARKKEFGMLQAVGLSDKQLIRMLQMEGLFYTAGMLLITLTLGNGIGYVAFRLFVNSGADYAVYKYPLIQSLILAGVTIAAQLALTYMVSKDFKKQSLVERIRYSE